MSRVGKKILVIPSGVQFSLSAGVVKVKGPKGEMVFTIPDGITCHQDGTSVTFTRDSDHKKVRALHGMTRAAIANMVEGVSAGFSRN
ncbi:MAG: 50S ribosomal protein L6, partial [Candidatus Kapaibacterium sp.]